MKVDIGFGGNKRRPVGDEVIDVLRRTFYRSPLYGKSHALLEHGDQQAACGRPILVDEEQWMLGGWEDILGPYFIVEDQRKAGQCSRCKTMIKEREDWERLFGVAYTPPPSPLTDELHQQLVDKIDKKAKNVTVLVDWVARQFNGEIVEEETNVTYR